MSLAQYTDSRSPRHLKVSGVNPTLSFEPCEDPGCIVFGDGTASSCGRLACPSCGCGGTNLSTMQLAHLPSGGRLNCTCGFTWAHGGMPVYVLTRAETAECTCPDVCERDHGND